MAAPSSGAAHKFCTLAVPKDLDSATKIRRAEREDAREIAVVFDKAFKGKFQYFWSVQAQEGEDVLNVFVRAVERSDGYLSWRNVIVVEYQGNVSACLFGLNEVQESWTEPNSDLCEDENAFLALQHRAHTLTGSSAIPSTWFIPYLAVLPELQGKGMGTALLHAALAEAEGCGKTQVSLVARENAAQARGLYEKRFGFKKIERLPVCKTRWKINADYWVILRKE